MPNNQMSDKEYLDDSLASQKLISDNYNTFANECVNPTLRNDFMNILGDEHKIQSEIFTEMQNRGWYQVKPADQQAVSQAKQKFQSSGM